MINLMGRGIVPPTSSWPPVRSSYPLRRTLAWKVAPLIASVGLKVGITPLVNRFRPVPDTRWEGAEPQVVEDFEMPDGQLVETLDGQGARRPAVALEGELGTALEASKTPNGPEAPVVCDGEVTADVLKPAKTREIPEAVVVGDFEVGPDHLQAVEARDGLELVVVRFVEVAPDLLQVVKGIDGLENSVVVSGEVASNGLQGVEEAVAFPMMEGGRTSVNIVTANS